jgi:trimethylamine---corrinoid protein Co-methyltransferase
MPGTVEADGATSSDGGGRGRRGRGGAEARRTLRGSGTVAKNRYIERQIPPYEPLSEEGLALVEANAETVLEEIGIEFREDPEALELWKQAGAEVDGRARAFPARPLPQADADHPVEFTQHARNPSAASSSAATPRSSRRSTGRPSCTTSTAAGATPRIEDFRNFVKLAYLARMHHSGGTVCEPVDVPVNKRHLDMVYAHMRYQRQAVHGLGDGARARGTPSRWPSILFGDDFVENNR